MAINTGWSRKDLAAHLSKDPSTVTRWLCPDDLVPKAKQAFLDGKFGFAKAYSIVKSDDQVVALDLTLKEKRETVWSGATKGPRTATAQR